MTGRRAQERLWEQDHAHTVAETRTRLQEIAARLPVTEAWRRLLVDAALQASRRHAMECAYASYELRTGFAYSPERRELEEEQEAAEWRACLARLDRAGQEHAPPRETDPGAPIGAPGGVTRVC